MPSRMISRKCRSLFQNCWVEIVRISAAVAHAPVRLGRYGPRGECRPRGYNLEPHSRNQQQQLGQQFPRQLVFQYRISKASIAPLQQRITVPTGSVSHRQLRVAKPAEAPSLARVPSLGAGTKQRLTTHDPSTYRAHPFQLGRVAQRESTPFTREGSHVQSMPRPPSIPIQINDLGPVPLCRFVLFGTERHTKAELGMPIRGESVERCSLPVHRTLCISHVPE
jgi:hypothetical protein